MKMQTWPLPRIRHLSAAVLVVLSVGWLWVTTNSKRVHHRVSGSATMSDEVWESGSVRVVFDGFASREAVVIVAAGCTSMADSRPQPILELEADGSLTQVPSRLPRVASEVVSPWPEATACFAGGECAIRLRCKSPGRDPAGSRANALSIEWWIEVAAESRASRNPFAREQLKLILEPPDP